MPSKRHPDTLRAMEVWKTQGGNIEKIARTFDIKPSTLYRALFPNGKRRYEKELALSKKV